MGKLSLQNGLASWKAPLKDKPLHFRLLRVFLVFCRLTLRLIAWSKRGLHLSFYFSFFLNCSPTLCVIFGLCCGNKSWCFAPTSNMLHVPFWQEHCHISGTDFKHCLPVLLCTAMCSVPKAKLLPLQIYSSKQLLRSMWNSECHLLPSLSSVLVFMLLFDFFSLVFFFFLLEAYLSVQR